MGNALKLISLEIASPQPVPCGVSSDEECAVPQFLIAEKEPRRVTCGASNLRDLIAGYHPTAQITLARWR